MGLIRDPLAEALERVTSFRDLRQSAISANIANASTPGYRAFDLVLRGALDDAGGARPLAPRRTDARHLVADGGLAALGVEVERSRAPARLDGNNVVLEQELLRLLSNRMHYLASVELMDRWKNLSAIARTLR